jgi:hypothetical protein
MLCRAELCHISFQPRSMYKQGKKPDGEGHWCTTEKFGDSQLLALGSTDHAGWRNVADLCQPHGSSKYDFFKIMAKSTGHGCLYG